MAASDSHLIGQLIGNWLEDHVSQPIISNCISNSQFSGLGVWYLDQEGPRQARDSEKVRWNDDGGNGHNLDYVIEFQGNEDNIGDPAAFIESAWRSYKKHSKAKAQEIEGAVMPVSVSSSVSVHAPFLGAIIAGRWTRPSITQLQSNGFEVLEFNHTETVSAFNSVGINVDFNEHTPLEELKIIREDLSNVGDTEKASSGEELIRICSDKVSHFSTSLIESLTRSFSSLEVSGGPVHLWEFIGGDLPLNFEETFAGDSGIRRWDLRITFTDERTALLRELTHEEINRILNQLSKRYNK